MASNEEREKHSRRRKRNLITKSLRDSGAFKPKVINPKKTDYKREHLSIRDITFGDKNGEKVMVNDDLKKLLAMYFEDYSVDDLLYDMSVDPAELVIAGIRQGVIEQGILEDILSDE